MEERCILIADDEINLCRILAAELGKAGYSVTTVHDGAQAVARVKSNQFQLVVLDVRMPILDGLNALREIHRIKEEIPVIMMTAYESHDTTATALAMGATACVSKPFDLESLVALVNATLDSGENGQKSISLSGSIRTVLFNKQQPIILEVRERNIGKQYYTKIEDKNDVTLSIACPHSDDGYVVPRAGTPLSVGFAGEDAFYSFEATVLATREGTPPVMVVGKPAVIYRIQRRKYPRAIAKIPVNVSILGKADEISPDPPSIRLQTEDFGAGGFRIVTREELPDGAEVEIRAARIPGLTRFRGCGKITRAQRVAINGHVDWEYGIQFTKLDDDTRRALWEVVESGELA